MVIKQYSILSKVGKDEIYVHNVGLGLNIPHAKELFCNDYVNGEYTVVNIQPVQGLNQYSVEFQMPCNGEISSATIFAKTPEEAREKFSQCFEAAFIGKVEEKKKGIIKKREITKMPEVALGRSCFSLGKMMWRINHDAADGRIEDGPHIGKQLEELSKKFDVYKGEVQKRIIAPKLKNCTVYNLNASFNSWQTAWCSFIYGMSDKKFESFDVYEKEYHSNGDRCLAYQKKKLPKKYADWKIWDLTDEGWNEYVTPKEREQVGPNTEVKFEA